MREGWEYKKIKEIGTIVTGNTPSTKIEEYYSSDEYCFIKPSDLPSEGFTVLIDSEYHISSKGYEVSRKLPKGSVLVSCIGIIGKTAILGIDACTNQQINAIVPKENINNRFLAYSILSQKFRLSSIANAPVVPLINKADFSNVTILFPPLDIQQSIVSELDKINELIRLKKEQLSNYDNLAQSLFYEMFGDPVNNEKGWEVKKLGEFSEVVRGGSPRPIDNYLGGDYPWIKIGDATKGNGIYLESTKEYIIKEGLNKTRYIPQGSMIFANCGVSLGFARIITFAGCIHDGWLAFMNIDEDIVNKIFFLKSLNFCTPYFRSLAPEGTQPNLNTKIMRCFHQILPPLPLQNLFAQRIELIEQQKAEIKSTIADLETLLASRMQYWFE